MSTTTENPVLAPASVTDDAAQPVTMPVRTLSIISLVLGGASVLFGYTFLVPIAAVVLGVLGYQREPAARALSVWGIVLGAVMSVGWIFVALGAVAFAGPWFILGSL